MLTGSKFFQETLNQKNWKLQYDYNKYSSKTNIQPTQYQNNSLSKYISDFYKEQFVQANSSQVNFFKNKLNKMLERFGRYKENVEQFQKKLKLKANFSSTNNATVKNEEKPKNTFNYKLSDCDQQGILFTEFKSRIKQAIQTIHKEKYLRSWNTDPFLHKNKQNELNQIQNSKLYYQALKGSNPVEIPGNFQKALSSFYTNERQIDKDIKQSNRIQAHLRKNMPTSLHTHLHKQIHLRNDFLAP